MIQGIQIRKRCLVSLLSLRRKDEHIMAVYIGRRVISSSRSARSCAFLAARIDSGNSCFEHLRPAAVRLRMEIATVVIVNQYLIRHLIHRRGQASMAIDHSWSGQSFYSTSDRNTETVSWRSNLADWSSYRDWDSDTVRVQRHSNNSSSHRANQAYWKVWFLNRNEWDVVSFKMHCPWSIFKLFIDSIAVILGHIGNRTFAINVRVLLEVTGVFGNIHRWCLHELN